MPAIYRIRCTLCGHSPQVNSGVAGYVTTDDGKAGTMLAEGYFALRLDSGEYVCLPHPAEQSTLKEHGFTWLGATRQGRLFHVTFKICTECGMLYEERQLSGFQAGCSIGAIGALIALLGMKLGLRSSWSSSLMGSYCAGVAVFGLFGTINWLRWRKPNSTLRLRICEHCKGTQFTTISRAAGKQLICPSCRQNGLRVELGGWS